MSHLRFVVIVVVGLVVVVGSARAQSGDTEPLIGSDGRALAEPYGLFLDTGQTLESPDGFGPNLHFSCFGASLMLPESSDETDYYNHSHGYYTATGGFTMNYFTADIGPSIGVPVGASLSEVCLLVYDNDAAGEVTLALWQHEQPPSNNRLPATRQLGATKTSGLAATPGYTSLCVTLSGVTIRAIENVNGDGFTDWVSYALAMRAHRSLNIRWGNGIVAWLRQVSPAPASATFTDVPTGYWAFRHIEALAASGITAGCSANQYCPEATLTRAQMAVFLAKALGLDFRF